MGVGVTGGDMCGTLAGAGPEQEHEDTSRARESSFFFFLGLHPGPLEVPRLGVPIGATAAGIRDASVTYTTAHGNTGDLTHGSEVRDPNLHTHRCYPGSLTAEPRQELPRVV